MPELPSAMLHDYIIVMEIIPDDLKEQGIIRDFFASDDDIVSDLSPATCTEDPPAARSGPEMISAPRTVGTCDPRMGNTHGSPLSRRQMYA